MICMNLHRTIIDDQETRILSAERHIEKLERVNSELEQRMEEARYRDDAAITALVNNGARLEARVIDKEETIRVAYERIDELEKLYSDVNDWYVESRITSDRKRDRGTPQSTS